MIHNFAEKKTSDTKISLNTQVIIMGAGPAGAGTSIFLTRAGIPHVIIEKNQFPRDKICGDACSGKTVFVLRKANPLWPDEIFKNTADYMPSHGVIFVSPNGKLLNIPFNPAKIPEGQAPGFITPRLIFDNFLFEKLASEYAAIYQKATVKSMERQADGKVKVSFSQGDETYEVTAPLIVGADGDKSQVRKNFLSSHSSSKAYCVGLRAYYHGVTGLHENHFIELHFLPEVLPGYFWIFPLPNGITNVGIGMMSDRIRKKKINLREEMLNAIKTNPNISHRFSNAKLLDKIQGWGLPMCMKRQPLSGDNFLLTGDAAGMIDPFTGEGIGNALYSGMLAAFAIDELLKADEYDAALIKEKYDDVLFKRIGNELKTSATLQRLCHYRWLFNFVVEKAHKSKTLNNTITSMFTGIDLRKQLRKPSFYARILLNR
ncbi:MAG TPA: NAD(P)/FAD-dependent oxidoreductase [Chitinophagaceae bacterium]|nr:NAD(P)/FAD-dependent oxidoreductase [Chitinophagaceae bacterium]